MGESLRLDAPPPRQRTPRSYRICDILSEALIYLMVVFTPWAFGTTQPWSIWTMNVTGFLLGTLLMAKWLIRWQADYRPLRWDVSGSDESVTESKAQRPVQVATVALATLTIVTLAYCLTSVLNARATFLPSANRFEYADYISWLPHSYDKPTSWTTFWNYLGLACFFWALRDWLLGKTRSERHDGRGKNKDAIEETEVPAFSARSSVGGASARIGSSSAASPALPVRLRRLLWVLCVNGGLLALESIFQRLSGTNKLLWLIVPRFNNTPEAQFGPYAYRSNAATYINLVWPVCLGFWMLLRRAAMRKHRTGARVGGGSYVLLLPCAVVMAAAPIFSISRGGAAVALLNMIIATFILFFAARREGFWIRTGMLSLLIAILGFSSYLGWSQLQERLQNIFVDNMSDRPKIYAAARPIARDFPTFGSGPGTFSTVYLLYKEPAQEWDAYAHDDFLETRITFGRVGSGLILALSLVVLARWFLPTGIRCSWEFMSLAWLSLAGCLLHAKFDFPFQIYSIHFLFLLICSVLFCLSRK